MCLNLVANEKSWFQDGMEAQIDEGSDRNPGVVDQGQIVKERVAHRPEWAQQRSCCTAWLKRFCNGKLLLICTQTLRTVTRI